MASTIYLTSLTVISGDRAEWIVDGSRGTDQRNHSHRAQRRPRWGRNRRLLARRLPPRSSSDCGSPSSPNYPGFALDSLTFPAYEEPPCAPTSALTFKAIVKIGFVTGSKGIRSTAADTCSTTTIPNATRGDQQVQSLRRCQRGNLGQVF
jgi:hypothetical protein